MAFFFKKMSEIRSQVTKDASASSVFSLGSIFGYVETLIVESNQRNALRQEEMVSMVHTMMGLLSAFSSQLNRMEMRLDKMQNQASSGGNQEVDSSILNIFGQMNEILHRLKENVPAKLSIVKCTDDDECDVVSGNGHDENISVRGSVQGSSHGTVRGSVIQGSVQGSVHEEEGSVQGSVHEEEGSVQGSVHEEVGSVQGSVHEEVGSVQGSVHEEVGSVQGSVHEEEGSVQGSVHEEEEEVIQEEKSVLESIQNEQEEEEIIEEEGEEEVIVEELDELIVEEEPPSEEDLFSANKRVIYFHGKEFMIEGDDDDHGLIYRSTTDPLWKEFREPCGKIEHGKLTLVKSTQTAKAGPLFLLPFELGNKDGHLYVRAKDPDNPSQQLFGAHYGMFVDGKVMNLKDIPVSPAGSTSSSSKKRPVAEHSKQAPNPKMARK